MKPGIIVGIPTYNESDSIAHVARQIDIGLQQAFEVSLCLIVNIDSDSEDDTKDVFLNTKTICPKEYINTGSNPRGKGKNLLRLFQLCKELDAECVATIDGDITTVTPEWPLLLLKPLLDNGFDYTVPIYKRNRFEGNTTNHFAFPLLYGVLGADIRQPIGGEFGVSRCLCEYLLEQKVIGATLQYGIDIFMTCHAAGGGFRISEAFLGRKFHKPSFPKIAPMFAQVAASGLQAVIGYMGNSLKVEIRKQNAAVRSGIDEISKPPSQEKKLILLQEMRGKFFANQTKNYKHFGAYSEEVAAELQEQTPNISADLWTNILAACVQNCFEQKSSESEFNILELVEALTPIFLWRVETFAQQAVSLNPAEIEKIIREQAELFQIKLQK